MVMPMRCYAVVPAPFLALFLCLPAVGHAAPYSYFGGEVDSEEKNEAIERCEYDELVEKQRCNERMNKSQCIRDIHAECRKRHENSGDTGAQGGRDRQPDESDGA
jgi:hypothetical protein